MKETCINIIKDKILKFDEMLDVCMDDGSKYAVSFARLCFIDVLHDLEKMEDELDNDWK